METNKIKKTLMPVIIDLCTWHTKLYKNVIDGISDKDAQDRLNTKANHIAWIAGSMLFGRYELCNLLGHNVKPASYELFKDYKGIQDGVNYPSLDEYRKEWDTISPLLNDALANVSEEQLSGPDPFNMPGGTFTFFDSLTACFDRESYCIGQVGLWRRLLGYEAMKYQ